MQFGQRSAILLALLMVVSAAGITLLFLPEAREIFAADPITSLVLIIFTPLMLLLLPYAARATLEMGESTAAKGELERLLQDKQDGTLTRKARRVPDRSARLGPRGPGPIGGQLPSDAESALGRLVFLKRHGRLNAEQ